MYVYSAFGDIVDCIEFTLGIYINIVVSCIHEVVGICSIFMVFEGHIYCSYMYGIMNCLSSLSLLSSSVTSFLHTYYLSVQNKVSTF